MTDQPSYRQRLTASLFRHHLLLSVLRIEELLKSLKDPSNLCLGDFGQSKYLSKGSRHTQLAAGNEEAASNNCVLRFAFEGFGIVNFLEQMLRITRDIRGNADGVTEGAELLVSSQESFGRLVMSGLVLSSM